MWFTAWSHKWLNLRELHGSEKQQVRDRNKGQKLLMFAAPCRRNKIPPTQQNQTVFCCQNPVFHYELPVTSFHWTETCVCHPLPGAGHPSATWSLGKGSRWERSPWLLPCSPAQSPPQAGPRRPHWWMGELQGAKVRRALPQHLSGGCEIRLGLQEEGVKPPVNPVKDKAIPWVVQLEQLGVTPKTAAELHLFTAHRKKERWKPIFQLFHHVLCHQNKRWFPRQDSFITVSQYFSGITQPYR